MSSPTTREAELAVRLDVAGAAVVDVGCGGGALVRWLSDAGADVIGLECNDTQRAAAVAADPDHADRYLDGVAEDMPLDDDCADIVIFGYSLHHVPVGAMGAALAEVHRILRPGGRVVVLEPIATGPGHEVDRLVHDETDVRAAARAAVIDATAIGFVEIDRATFETTDTYADFADYEAVMVGVDPARAERMAAVRDDVEARFRELARRDDAGWTFPQPNELVILEKVEKVEKVE